MGNSFGHYGDNAYDLKFHPDVTPDPNGEPTFTPNFGFPKERKERVMIATKEEMVSAKIPLDKRDYCAHLLLKFQACRKDAWPFPVFCEHEKHEYLNCQNEDLILRMKEYERERRLKTRVGTEPEQKSVC